MISLKGKTAIVTGASRGIGAAAVILITPENFPDWKSWVLFAAAFLASWWWKASPIITIIAGGVLGLILY